MIPLLSKYHRQIEKSFLKNYRKTRKSYSVEGIHKMRLSIKRLRAFLSIINNFEKQSGIKKNLKKISLLFRYAGELRDIQVQLNLMENYKNEAGDDFNIYYTQILNREKKAYKALKRSFNRIDIGVMTKISRQIEKSLKRIENVNFNEEYIKLGRGKMNDIRDLSIAINDDSVLHLIRKRIKEILFMQEIIDSGDFIMIGDKDLLTFLNDIEIKLGEWHDVKVLLDNFLSLKHSGDSYRDIIDKIEQNKLGRQKEIAEKLQHFAVKF